MEKIIALLNEGKNFLRKEFNLGIEKSKIKLYSNKQWSEFCKLNNFEEQYSGLYLPEYYLAYVNKNSKFLIPDMFHELYGHGLFCEKSILGKELTNIIKEKRLVKDFLYSPIDLSKQIFGFMNYNIKNYEGFAMWLESKISIETGNKKLWEEKKQKLPKENVNVFEQFKQLENKISSFGLISQMGFPKYYSEETIRNLFSKLYSERLNSIDLAILYGSKKPESDIDLFIVSNNKTNNYFNGWLDVYEVNRDDFKYWLNNLDISITDPLFSGILIYGNENYFNFLKSLVIKTPISQESINYNISEAKKQQKILENNSLNNYQSKLCKSYINSFYKNSKQLVLGNKHLTLKNLNNAF